MSAYDIRSPGEGRLGGSTPGRAAKKQKRKKAPAKRVNPSGGRPSLTPAQQAALDKLVPKAEPATRSNPLTKSEQDDVKAQIIANSFLKGVDPVLRESATKAPGAFASGVNILGPNLYRVLGGDSPSPAIPKKGSKAWAGVEAVGILPFGKFGRGVGAGAKALKGGKVARDVPKAIEGATIRNKFPSQGAKQAAPLGGVRAKFPSSAEASKGLPKSESVKVSAEALAPEEQLRKGMKGAKRGYEKQKVARNAERSARAKKAAAAYRDIPDPLDAHLAAKSALKGELPKNQLNAVPGMTQDGLKQLMKTVNAHKALLPFQKTTTNDALIKVFEGGQPAPHQMRLIEHVFGADETRKIAAITGGTWGDKVINALNIPRSMQSTADISGLTRQAFVAMTTHPIIWGKASPTYIRAFRERNYRLIDAAIKNDPLYPLAVGHVSFSGIGDGVSLLAHEDAFASEYATKIPGIGRAVKGSAQGYVAFLNKIRMDMFSHFVRLEVKAGRDPHREEFLKSVGDVINAATGRGAIHGRLEHVMPAANTMLYSPRLMLSRLNYFDPSWYVRLKGRRARIEALKGLFATSAYVTGVVTLLSQIPGVEVGSLNPLSSDFGKLKQGDTRVDVAAGFLQYVHLAAMLEANAKINSTSGNRIEFGTGFGKQTRWDQVQNFFVNKASPPVSFGIGQLRGHDPVGGSTSLTNPGDAAHVAGNLFIPLSIQDATDLYKQKKGGLDGITAAAAGYGLSSVGFGLQTYGAKKSRSGSSPAENPYSGGDSPYASPGSAAKSPYDIP